MLDGVEPLEGTTITLSFLEGWVSGESGCNSYSGGYMILEPDVLSLPGFNSTSMGCDDPPGVLEQEVAYQRTLLQAVTYRATDQRLELQNAAGQTTLVYEQIPTGHAPTETSETTPVTDNRSTEAATSDGQQCRQRHTR